MKIEMTGAEDRTGPWKTAVCGFAGVGKTLFASTAPDPLFVFFQDNPRLKSIADRAIPHVKVTNEPELAAHDKLKALVIHLEMEDHQYKTLVVDTGDELFQAMKAARTFQNGGEFNIGDWGWIGDTYREVMFGLIDLPMDVIVLYHIKSTTDDESVFRELMLQGQAKDEAPGWFDIVGVLDTFEVVGEDGAATTKRALLTHSSRLYPWVKDHSGALPRRFDLSPGFTDDYRRMMALVQAVPDVAVSHEELGDIEVPEEKAVLGKQPVPSPEELQAKKEEVSAPVDTIESDQQGSQPELLMDTQGVEEESIPPQDTETGLVSPVSDDVDEAVPADSGDDGSVDGVVTGAAASDDLDSQEQGESAEDEESFRTLEEAAALVASELSVEEVQVCAVCGNTIDDNDLAELTQIRFRKYLCREHFKEALQEAKGM